MRSILTAAALAVATLFLVFAAMTTPVFAAETGSVLTLDWGNIALAALSIGITVVGLVLSRVLWVLAGFLPAWARAVITPTFAAMAESLIKRGMAYAYEEVEKAIKGKTLDLDTGSSFVAEALKYVLDQGGGWLLRWLGTPEQIAQKIIARLDDMGMGLDLDVPASTVAKVANDNVPTALKAKAA